MNSARSLLVVLAILFYGPNAVGQASSAPVSDNPASKCNGQVRSTYLLGPDDQLEISGPELTDSANKPVRIDSQGDVQVPLVGRMHVAGMTVQDVEQNLDKALSTYIRDPQVVVNVTEVRSAPVS